MPSPFSRTVRVILASTTIALLTPAAMAQVTPQKEGNITYITGGIGRAETDALKAVQADYNLLLTSSNTEGYFVGDTALKILDSQGKTLVTALAGPLFYAKLPAGTYTLEATRAGEVKKQRVTIGKAATRAYFTWAETSKDEPQEPLPTTLPWNIPPLGTTTERVTGTIVIEAPETPPAEAPPAPVFQATPIR